MRLCSSCGIRYPDGVTRCQVSVCQTWLDSRTDADFDRDYQKKVAIRNANPDIDDEYGEEESEEGKRECEWRYRQMRRAGIDAMSARMLAESRVSHHDVEDLLGRGCPPELVVKLTLP